MENNIYRNPNLFVVGAAKAGTTSIYNYLNKHPEIFMSPVKEPHYFSKDIRCKYFTQENCMNACFDIKKYFSDKTLKTKHIAFIEDKDDYLQLFRDVKAEKIKGETSTGYLYSDLAAEEIYNFNVEAKVLIILRDPVQRAYSHWKMNLAAGIENNEKSFLDAVQKDFESTNKGYCKSHLYIELGQYTKQIERYKKLFSSKNIQIMFFEDLNTDVNGFMNKVYSFLNLPSLEHDKDSKENVSAMIRFSWLKQLNSALGISKVIPKQIRSILKKNLTTTDFPKLTQEDYSFLYAKYFKEDIVVLEQLLKVDLSSWKYGENEKQY